MKSGIAEKIFAYMKEQYKILNVNMLFFMLTDMMKPGTELLCYGDGAESIVSEGFNVQVVDGAAFLPGVVSRKKQIVPQIMMEISQ